MRNELSFYLIFGKKIRITFLGLKREIAMEYFEKLRGQLAHRHGGFDYIFRYLSDLQEPVIVETGCVRDALSVGCEGHSSILFDRFVGEHGGEFYTVDNSMESCMVFREHITSSRTHLTLGESVPYLHDLNKEFKSSGKQVDLLYLDSMDASFDDEAITNKSARHHLYELFSILPSLRPGGLICVDDNWLETKKIVLLNEFARDASTKISLRGKGHYIAEYMEFLRNDPCYVGYQLIWRWN